MKSFIENLCRQQMLLPQAYRFLHPSQLLLLKCRRRGRFLVVDGFGIITLLIPLWPEVPFEVRGHPGKGRKHFF